MRDLGGDWVAAMRAGDFTRAWTMNDAVLASRDASGRDDPRLAYHLRWVWDGRRFRGRHVLVRCYHGLGDTLMFARFLPLLRQQAARVTVEAQPELLPLLVGAAGVEALVPFVLDKPLPPAECDMEIMELPHALGVGPETVPPFRPLVPACGDFSRGLCWRSGGWDTERDVPEAMMAPLARGAVSLRPEPTGLPVLNPGGCPPALADTSRVVAGCRLVITVDTMVAHLAGSLGRPTWLLLKHDADWRWMAERTDSPWYPGMRIFRQPAPGDWDSVMAAVSAALRASG